MSKPGKVIILAYKKSLNRNATAMGPVYPKHTEFLKTINTSGYARIMVFLEVHGITNTTTAGFSISMNGYGNTRNDEDSQNNWNPSLVNEIRTHVPLSLPGTQIYEWDSLPAFMRLEVFAGANAGTALNTSLVSQFSVTAILFKE